jgi:hypothetical protein
MSLSDFRLFFDGLKDAARGRDRGGSLRALAELVRVF